MACNYCETTFQAYQTLVVTVFKNGSNATLWMQNQGRNAVLIERVILCATSPAGGFTLYLRPPPDPIS